MRIFVCSDTHEYPDKKIAQRELTLIGKTAKERQCDCIIHCGDLANIHFGNEYFGALPIYVFRTDMNNSLSARRISNLPPNWHILENRPQVLEFGTKKILRIFIDHYLGTKVLGADIAIPPPEVILAEEIDEMREKYGFDIPQKIIEVQGEVLKRLLVGKLFLFELVAKIREKYGDVHYALCGHLHHQFSFSALNTLVINPGAFGMGYNGYKRSYAIIDTKTWDVISGVAHLGQTD